MANKRLPASLERILLFDTYSACQSMPENSTLNSCSIDIGSEYNPDEFKL